MAMTDDLEAALDSIEHPADLFDKAWLLTVYVPAATTLAAAVRGRVCGTCRRSVRYMDNGILYCDLLRNATADVPCQLVGNTCGAWAGKGHP